MQTVQVVRKRTPGLMTSAAPTASSICGRFELSEAACELLTPHLSSGEFLQRLTERQLYSDALRLVTYALAKREAVWFGCLAVQHLQAAGSSEEHAALGAAFHWVIDPTEQRRLACGRAGNEAELTTPAGALAMAGFWTGGSMDDQRSIPPPENLSARTIAGAVALAVAGGQPQENSQRYCQAIILAIDVSAGAIPWTKSRS